MFTTKINKGIPELSDFNKIKSPNSFSFAEINFIETNMTIYFVIEGKKDGNKQYWLCINQLSDKLATNTIENITPNENNNKFEKLIDLGKRDLNLVLILDSADSLKYSYSFENHFSIPLSFKPGFSVYSSYMYTNNIYSRTNWQNMHQSVESENKMEFMPISFSINFKLLFFEKNQIEFKPGISYCGNYYTGLDLGFFYSRFFTNKVFGSVGTVLHGNIGESTNSKNIRSGWNYYVGGLFGYGFIKSIAATLGFFYVMNPDYGKVYRHSTYSDPTLTTTRLEPKLRWFFRLGLEFNY